MFDNEFIQIPGIYIVDNNDFLIFSEFYNNLIEHVDNNYLILSGF